MANSNGYEEVIYVAYRDNLPELLVHHDVDTRRVIHIYAYVEDLETFPKLYAPGPRSKITWTWEDGLNPLFKHMEGADPQLVWKQLKRRFRV